MAGKAPSFVGDEGLAALFRELSVLDDQIGPLEARRKALAAEIAARVLAECPGGYWYLIADPGLRAMVTVARVYIDDIEALREIFGNFWARVARRRRVFTINRVLHLQLIERGLLPPESLEDSTAPRVTVTARPSKIRKRGRKETVA